HHARHDNWNRSRQIDKHAGSDAADGDNQIGPRVHDFACGWFVALGLGLARVAVYDQIAALDKAARAEFAKERTKLRNAVFGHVGEPFRRMPHGDAISPARRLRPRGERRRGKRKSACGEGAAMDHSITSSARVRTDNGTSIPRALAVFMLSSSSNLVGCWMGKSPAFSPLRMRAT